MKDYPSNILREVMNEETEEKIKNKSKPKNIIVGIFAATLGFLIGYKYL